MMTRLIIHWIWLFALLLFGGFQGASAFGRGLPRMELVYEADTSGDIYRLDARTRVHLNLTKSTANDVDPAWAADGERIIFASDREGTLGLYEMQANGTGLHALQEMQAIDGWAPTLSPDGTRIAYLQGTGTFVDVHVQADGRSQPVTRDAIASSPVWSPDGSQIVFVNAHLNMPDLYLVSSNGGAPRRLTRDAIASAPDWSPDGSQIAYTRRLEGERQLCITTLAAANRCELSLGARVHGAAWSPDGTQIAYVQDSHLFLVNRTGADNRLLSQHDTVQPYLAWAPDGTQIGFAANTSPTQVDLFAVHTETKQTRRLTFGGGAELDWRPVGE